MQVCSGWRDAHDAALPALEPTAVPPAGTDSGNLRSVRTLRLGAGALVDTFRAPSFDLFAWANVDSISRLTLFLTSLTRLELSFVDKPITDVWVSALPHSLYPSRLVVSRAALRLSWWTGRSGRRTAGGGVGASERAACAGAARLVRRGDGEGPSDHHAQAPPADGAGALPVRRNHQGGQGARAPHAPHLAATRAGTDHCTPARETSRPRLPSRRPGMVRRWRYMMCASTFLA